MCALMLPLLGGCARSYAARHRQRNRWRSGMVKTIAVGTDGSDTAQKAVDFALDMAERYKAKVVIASAYVPVSESRLQREKVDAPDEIQWSINPSEEVDETLRKAEEQAKDRGLDYA